ncbi:MAG: NAD-dependent epimerase/dehydratase family protein [Streptosporangiaceae bacterium]
MTGGAGFIGSHIVDALVERGERVLVVDDLSTGAETNISAAATQGVDLERVSILDQQRINAVFARWRPTTVYHLAAQMDVRRSVMDITFDAHSNVLGTLNVLVAARAVGVRRLVNTSTGGAIYGPELAIPTPEGGTPEPLAPYGVSKLCAEQYVSWFQRAGGLSTVSLRYGNVYGPRQNPHGEAGVVAIFGQALAAGEPVTVFGDGLQTRDFVFVSDVVAANVFAADADVTGVVNIGTGRATSVLDILQALEQRAGRAATIYWAPAREGEVRDSCLSVRRARETLGFEASVSLMDGIARTWQWLARYLP